MAGDQDLLRLAHLLRLCAETAMSIAKVRRTDGEDQIADACKLACAAADRLEGAAAGSPATARNHGIEHH